MSYPRSSFEKENSASSAKNSGYDFMEHLKFSVSSCRNSIDRELPALKEYNRVSMEAMKREDRRCKQQEKKGLYHRNSGSNEFRHRSSQRREGGSRGSQPKLNPAYENTIALFGAYGVTGNYFLKLAVEAGYHVRALMLPGVELAEMKENPNISLVTGTLDDEAKVHRVIRKSKYVVCMLNDCPEKIQQIQHATSSSSNYNFIQKLVPLMGKCVSCSVLLYQASSFASDARGNAPMLSNVIKKIPFGKARREILLEHDKIIRHICSEVEENEDIEFPFDFIVTRPSNMIWDRPSRKKLSASKSLPGPFPITNIDLAEFSLNALKTENLYNTCPYVVQDGI